MQLSCIVHLQIIAIAALLSTVKASPSKAVNKATTAERPKNSSEHARFFKMSFSWDFNVGADEGLEGGNTLDSEEECRVFRNDEDVLSTCVKRGYFPVANHCRVFQSCKKAGASPRSACCPSELSFDHKLRKCVAKSDARCKDVCNKKGTRFADPYNLNGYLECTKRGIPEEFQCKNDFHYDASNHSCVSGALEAKKLAEEMHPGLIEDILAGYEIPEEREENVTTQETSSGFGRSFGAKKPRRKYFCDPSKRDRSGMEKCPSKGNYPIRNDCKLFLKCFEAGKAPFFICCPPNLLFDHRLKRCVEEQDAKCENVCKHEGTTYLNPNNPTGYLKCTKKGIPEEFSCPEKHRFILGSGKCVPAQEDVELIKKYQLDNETVKELNSGIEFPTEDEMMLVPSTDEGPKTASIGSGDVSVDSIDQETSSDHPHQVIFTEAPVTFTTTDVPYTVTSPEPHPETSPDDMVHEEEVALFGGDNADDGGVIGRPTTQEE